MEQEYYVLRSYFFNDVLQLSKEVWKNAYGDCLISSEEIFRGYLEEVKQYCQEKGIEEVITIGLRTAR